jgi:hypothetical protein
MDDLLEAARSGVAGTAADFSNWSGVKQGDFKHMKINSTEKVFDPTEEQEFNEEEKVQEVTTEELPKEETPIEVETPKTMDKPGVQQAYLNPTELKNIAVKLMPTVDVLLTNTQEPLDVNIMRHVSEAAINLAFEFLQVWNEKVSVES